LACSGLATLSCGTVRYHTLVSPVGSASQGVGIKSVAIRDVSLYPSRLDHKA
jgi:hypothetical protein